MIPARSWLIAIALSLASLAHGQEPQAPRFVILDDYVRERLARDWEAHLHDRPILERAYCVGFQLEEFAGEVAYRVTQIVEADSVEATVNSARFACPRRANVAEIHTHPPQTCTAQGVCWWGGVEGWECFPSDQDRAHIGYFGMAFGLVQCDTRAVVAFFSRTP